MILDAGCGVGGTTRYIAQKYEVETVGIANSKTLIEKAGDLNQKADIRGNALHLMADFHNTCFKNNSFNKIIFIESACYSENYQVLFNEIHRLLKPGGHLMVADFFRTTRDLAKSEEAIYHDWLDGWAMPPLATLKDYQKAAEKSNMGNFSSEDVTPFIYKSSEHMHEGAKNVLPGTYRNHIEGKFPESTVKHVISGIRQKECIDHNIWTYNFISARKAFH